MYWLQYYRQKLILNISTAVVRCQCSNAKRTFRGEVGGSPRTRPPVDLIQDDPEGVDVSLLGGSRSSHVIAEKLRGFPQALCQTNENNNNERRPTITVPCNVNCYLLSTQCEVVLWTHITTLLSGSGCVYNDATCHGGSRKNPNDSHHYADAIGACFDGPVSGGKVCFHNNLSAPRHPIL